MKSNLVTRRTVLRSGSAFGVAAMTSGLAAPYVAAQSLPKITVMQPSTKSFLWAPADYARHLGLFAKHGVEVETLGSNRGVNITGVIAGDIDVGLGDPTEAMNVRRQGQKVKVFGLMHNRYTSHVIVRKELMDAAGLDENSPEAERAQLLRGLKMGHPGVGSGPEMMIRYCATLGGVDPNTELDLVSVTGGGAGLLAAVEQGSVDGIGWCTPNTSIANERFGTAYLFQMLRNPPELFRDMKSTALQASEQILETRREPLIGYVAGLAEAFASIQSDPEAFKDWLRGFLDTVEPEIFDVAFEDSFPMYTQDPVPIEETFPKFVEFLDVVNETRGQPPIEPIPYAELVDPTLAEEAMKLI